MSQTKKKATKKKSAKKKTTQQKVVEVTEPKVEEIDLYCFHCKETNKLEKQMIRVIREAKGDYMVDDKKCNKLTWFVADCPNCKSVTAGQIKENE